MTEQSRSLEERVLALEATASGREVRLTEGVERLTDETAGLTAILTRVDDQQRALTDLQRRAKDSEDRTEEVEHSVLDFRKDVVARSLTFALVLSGVFLAIAGGLYVYVENRQDNALRICRERNQGARLVQQYVEAQTSAVQSDPNRTAQTKAREVQALQNLGRSFPIVDCNNDGTRV